jgi:hypothetical protein
VKTRFSFFTVSTMEFFMRIPLLLFAALALAAMPARAEPRFGGQARISKPTSQQSADRRFEASASLLPADAPGIDEKRPEARQGTPAKSARALPQQGGRFGLSANLINANAPLACTTGGDNIFKNGFE